MGGHGGLNILPQKRWNVYRRDNRLRVRRDEEQHRQTQQRRRQQEERQRMSDVLILLKRKKAEALARHQTRRSSSEKEKTQPRGFQSSATNSSGVDDASHASWLKSLVDFGEVCRRWRTAGKSMCRTTPARAGCGSLLVSPFPNEYVSAGLGTTRTHADGFSRFSKGEANLNSLSTGAGAGCWLPSCPRCMAVSDYSSTARLEFDGESSDTFLQEQPSVVRVRLPTSADCTASAIAEESSGVASSPFPGTANRGAAHIEYISSAICIETDAELSESAALVVDQGDTYPGETQKQNLSTEILQDSLPQEQHRAKGEMRHVNFFEAEESEMRKLEMKRRKYLRDAGYTPHATSEFEREIRASLHQVPWYYKPPSTSAAPKPLAGSSVWNTQNPDKTLQHQSQPPLQQNVGSSRDAIPMKQHQTAASAKRPVEQDQLREARAPARGTENHEMSPPLTAESGIIAGTKEPTMHFSVNAKQRGAKEANRAAVKTDEPTHSKNEKKTSQAQDAKRKRRSNHSARHERSEKKKRRSRKERSKKEEDAEDDVECLQVLLLVQDEEESSTTRSLGLSATAPPLSFKEEKSGMMEHV